MTERLTMSKARDLVRDALAGPSSENENEPGPVTGIQSFGDGTTWVDAEYDERLRAVLRPLDGEPQDWSLEQQEAFLEAVDQHQDIDLEVGSALYTLSETRPVTGKPWPIADKAQSLAARFYGGKPGAPAKQSAFREWALGKYPLGADGYWVRLKSWPTLVREAEEAGIHVSDDTAQKAMKDIIRK